MVSEIGPRVAAKGPRSALSKIFVLLVIGLLAQGGCSTSEAASPKPSNRSIHIRDSTPTGSRHPAETRPDGAIRLTTPPVGASDQNPAFSPDGTRLVFTRFDEGYNDGPAGLFLLERSSLQVTRLTPVEDQDNVNLPGAAWNRRNDRIVFASDRLESDDLWRIAPDGIDLSRITTHSDPRAYFEPSWSPDSRWIVFEMSEPGPSADGRIGHVWKVRADGSELTQLTSGAFDDRQPNWSAAGERVLFQRRTLPDGQWDLYTIAPDGSDLQNVTRTPEVDETDASWSSNGTCIVYSSDAGELPVANLFIIPATGGQTIQATFSEGREDGAPSWSPDGKWIAFESHEGQDVGSPSALWQLLVPEGVRDRDLYVYLLLMLNNQPPNL